MPRIYHIEITDGFIKFRGAPAPRLADEFLAPNAKQYFAKRNKVKPAGISVKGWPFNKMYLTHGDESNGAAVAWA